MKAGDTIKKIMQSKAFRWLFIIAVIAIVAVAAFFIFVKPMLSGSDDEIEIAKSEKAYEILKQSYDQYDVSGKPYEFIKKYDDMVGWIKIPKTDFSYPVMQNPPAISSDDKTNVKDSIGNPDDRIQDYYLHRDVNGAYSFYGTPFIDDRCTIFSDNRIIYGHNINGHRYFGYLHYYKDKDFYKKHPRIVYLDEFKKAYYEIISVVKTNTSSYIYDFIDLGNAEEHDNALRHIVDDSIYKTVGGKRLIKSLKKWKKNTPYPAKLLTLSTCRTSEGKNERLLIIAIRSSDI